MTYVVVHRSRLAKWCYEPWSVIVAAAERGDDDLRVVDSAPSYRPMLRQVRPEDPREFAPGWDDWSEIAFLYEAGSSWPKDKALLFQQNWTA
jgi:hypothetical protein